MPKKKHLAGHAACPVCKGHGSTLYHGEEVNCNNCEATGSVFIRRDGTPCIHEYDRERVGGQTIYTCIYCQHQKRSL
jgi:uncharacterized protein YbaR (Trm112 family)